MTPLSYFRQLYSLDTLDTRFTTTAQSKNKATQEDPAKSTRKDGTPSTSIPEGASPSRWNTIEFYIYGLVFLFCVPQMYWTVVQVSQRTVPIGKACDRIC